MDNQLNDWENEGGSVKLADVRNPIFDGPPPTNPKKESYSPSVLLRKAVCPGYIRDEDGDETYAELGKMAHKAVETESMTDVPEEWRSAIQTCIDFKKHLMQMFPGGHYVAMQEHDINYLDQHGIIDFLLVDRSQTYAEIVDWKFAKNWYPADSPQFHAYAVGVWDQFPTVEKILVRVVHPFFQNDQVDLEAFTRTQHYDKFMSEIGAIIAAGRRNNPAEYRVTAQCAQCGFAGQCPKLTNFAIEVARRYAPELQLPEGTLHGSDIQSPNVMSKLLAARPVIAQVISGWYKAAMGMLLKGEDVDGYELAHRNGRRSGVPAKAVYSLIKEEFIPDMPIEDFLTHCTASPTGLDELISDATPTGQKAKMVQKLKCRLEDQDILSVGQGSDYIQKTRS